MAWLTGWNYRKQITVSATEVDDLLSDFPLTVPVSRSDVENHYGHSDGNDIRFTADDGKTLLSHIWEGWSEDGYSGAYVKIPTIHATSGATIYMYYGNASASDTSNPSVVLADYAVFWPARHWTNGQLELANNIAISENHPSANLTAATDGVRFGGYLGLQVGDTTSLTPLLQGKTGLTISCLAKDFTFPTATIETDTLAWILSGLYTSDFYIGNRFVGTDRTNSTSWTFINYDYGTSKRYNKAFDSGIPSDENLSMHFAFRHQLQSSPGYSSLKLDLDNVSKVSESQAETATTYDMGTAVDPLFLGGHPYSSSTIPFTIAEFRIRKAAASNAWLKFERVNLMLAGNQLAFAEEESFPGVNGPYRVAMLDTFQSNIQQAETYIPGIMAGHTHGT